MLNGQSTFKKFIIGGWYSLFIKYQVLRHSKNLDDIIPYALAAGLIAGLNKWLIAKETKEKQEIKDCQWS